MPYWLHPRCSVPWSEARRVVCLLASLTLRTEVQRLHRFSEEVQRTALVKGKPHRAVPRRRAGPRYYPRTTRTERGNGSRRRATAVNAETKRCGWIAVAGFSVESGDNEPLRFRVPRDRREHEIVGGDARKRRHVADIAARGSGEISHRQGTVAQTIQVALF
jgi:hypothetical protein